ncbi:hypothetical protein ColLi_07424 [Colletotrichum liriopes]|uniref:Uncharacterized protein n=1 Tax=Colletotrichum liriopes TaxID=708192 RepID=A0AA37GP20_9PEZI|nr:hypothetical protein ColLi_07424 [Colletotrichum liriopes]
MATTRDLKNTAQTIAYNNNLPTVPVTNTAQTIYSNSLPTVPNTAITSNYNNIAQPIAPNNNQPIELN